MGIARTPVRRCDTDGCGLPLGEVGAGQRPLGIAQVALPVGHEGAGKPWLVAQPVDCGLPVGRLGGARLEVAARVVGPARALQQDLVALLGQGGSDGGPAWGATVGAADQHHRRPAATLRGVAVGAEFHTVGHRDTQAALDHYAARLGRREPHQRRHHPCHQAHVDSSSPVPEVRRAAAARPNPTIRPQRL